MFTLLSTLFAILGIAYISIRVIYNLPVNPKLRWIIFSLMLIASFHLYWLRLLKGNTFLSPWADQINFIISLIQGFNIMLFIITVYSDLLKALWYIIIRPFTGHGIRSSKQKIEKDSLKHKKFKGKMALTYCFLSLCLLGIGAFEAFRVPNVKEVEIKIKELPSELNNFKITLLSDLHIGTGFNKEWLTKVVSNTNNLNSEIIAVIGDVVDGPVLQLKDEVAPLKNLKAPYGIFFVPGNHEYYSGYAAWMQEFKDLGLKTLPNESTILTVKNKRILISGLTDLVAKVFNDDPPPSFELALKDVPDDLDLKILLWHQPRGAEQAAHLKYDLQLSGHTHGGQLWGIGYFITFFNKYLRGLYNVNDMKLYVSSGTGVWGRFPLRLGIPSEITLITLKKE